MTRAAAVTYARTGAHKIWAGTVQIHPNAKTAPHHHGELESVIYVISGSAHALGEHLEFLPMRSGVLSMCRLMFRIKKLMPGRMNRSCAWSCAATRTHR
jgi:hypothetical protein